MRPGTVNLCNFKRSVISKSFLPFYFHVSYALLNTKNLYFRELVDKLVFLCFPSQISRYENQGILIGLSVCLFGFFGLALLPVGLELGVECTYPVAEATSAGLLWLVG